MHDSLEAEPTNHTREQDLAAACQAALDFYEWHMNAVPSEVLEELIDRRAALQGQLKAALSRVGPVDHTREQEHNATLRYVLTQLSTLAELIKAIKGLLVEPYGCSLCDCGVSRNPEKGHQPDCPYVIARKILRKALGNPLLHTINKTVAEPAMTNTDLIIHLTPVIHREGNMYVGWVQEVPGANAQASTGDELRRALEEAVMLIISEAKRTSQE